MCPKRRHEQRLLPHESKWETKKKNHCINAKLVGTITDKKIQKHIYEFYKILFGREEIKEYR